jgi:rhamnosyltransferase
MYNNIKISACVVLYNPGENIFNNVNLILEQIQYLYIIDNSDLDKCKLLFDKENISYFKNKGNKGIATALNQAARQAIADGFNYLLTMDQDSILDPHLIDNYIKYLHSNISDRVGLLSPNYLYKEYSNNTRQGRNYTVLLSMTSGSLLNLTAFKIIGPFVEELFIDYVDFEYCLRLGKKGYNIIKVHNANIYHNLGSIQQRKFLFRKVSITNHSPLRLFYRTRNRFYIYKSYLKDFPVFVIKYLFFLINELIKILFYEKSKREKFRWILKGFNYFLKKKMGKYES